MSRGRKGRGGGEVRMSVSDIKKHELKDTQKHAQEHAPDALQHVYAQAALAEDAHSFLPAEVSVAIRVVLTEQVVIADMRLGRYGWVAGSGGRSLG